MCLNRDDVCVCGLENFHGIEGINEDDGYWILMDGEKLEEVFYIFFQFRQTQTHIHS